jgi:t-SNARE complex subunit (syntaxin)
VKVVDGGTRLSAARTDECRPSRKEKIVYIGLGTIVIIIVIVVVVMMLRR